MEFLQIDHVEGYVTSGSRNRVTTYLVCMHIESIDRQVISRQVQTLEHLFKGQLMSISENDDFLWDNRMESLSALYDPATRKMFTLGALFILPAMQCVPKHVIIVDTSTQVRKLTLDKSQQVLLIHTS